MDTAEEIYDGNIPGRFARLIRRAEKIPPPIFITGVVAISFGMAVIATPFLPRVGYKIPSGEALEHMSAGKELRANIPNADHLTFRFDTKDSDDGHLLWDLPNGKNCSTPTTAIFKTDRDAGEPFIDIKLTAGIITPATICR